MKITIPEIPPSLNKYAGRANAWDYRTEKQLPSYDIALAERMMEENA